MSKSGEFVLGGNLPKNINNHDSLRQQMIDAMAPRLGAPLAESVFQHDLWPVLDKAMTAGELLVARNITPQTPVHTAIEVWLYGCLGVMGTVRPQEDTVSKRDLLKLIYDLAESASKALAETQAINNAIKNG